MKSNFRYDPRFLQILFWEALENAPMLIGFLLAVRLQSQNLILALAALMVGAACGAGLIHFTESKKYSNQPSLKETLVNFLVVTVLGIPFAFYFSSNGVWWSNWGTDLGLGIVAGLALAFGESLGWSNTATVKMHALSMAVAVVLFMLGIRFSNIFDPWLAMLLVGGVFNLFVSAIIVFFDYWPIKESDQRTSLTSV